jgi:hypothetical protein
MALAGPASTDGDLDGVVSAAMIGLWQPWASGGELTPGHRVGAAAPFEHDLVLAVHCTPPVED